MKDLRICQFILAALLLSTAEAVPLESRSSDDTEIVVYAPGGSSAIRFQSRISDSASTLWREIEDSYLGTTGVAIQVVDASHNESVDLVEISLHEAIDGCDSGLLNLLPLHKMSSQMTQLDQHLFNSIQPCAVGHAARADVIVFRKDQHGIEQPSLSQDFFNLDAFPGRRVAKPTAESLSEWALMSHGVPLNRIYQAQSAANSWSIIRDTLDSITHEMMWVNSDREALELLDAGGVRFAVVSSDSLVRRLAKQGYSPRYGVIWSGAVAHINMLAVPTHSENPQDALKVLEVVTEPETSLYRATSAGYAPVHLEYSMLVQDNYTDALLSKDKQGLVLWGNRKWWRDEGADIREQFHQQYIRSDSTASIAASELGSGV